MSDASFLWLVAGSTLADGIAAGSVLRMPRARCPADAGSRRPLGVGRILLAGLAAAGAFVVKVAFLVALAHISTFGVIHLIYADATVMVPAIGALLLLGSSRSMRGACRWEATPAARGIALGSLALALVGGYATWIEPFRLQLETARVRVPAARAGRSAIRIGVLADLQTSRVTDYERRAVARLMELEPDLIVLPGDLFQGSPAEFEENRGPLHDLLARLSAPAGVYFVLGDFDAAGGRLDSLLRSTEVKLLANESVRVRVGDRRVTIGGVELDVRSPRARRTIEQLEDEPGADDLRILVAHRPDAALQMGRPSRIDLVIAGHTHGGQVVIPGFGPPLTLTRVPRTVAAGGLHRLAGNAIYVSRGVGCERGQAPRIRFFCPPEISLLTLESPHAE